MAAREPVLEGVLKAEGVSMAADVPEGVLVLADVLSAEGVLVLVDVLSAEGVPMAADVHVPANIIE